MAGLEPRPKLFYLRGSRRDSLTEARWEPYDGRANSAPPQFTGGQSMPPRTQSVLLRAGAPLLSLAGLLALAPLGGAEGFRTSDLSRFRFVGDAVFSPDSRHIAYTVSLYD